MENGVSMLSFVPRMPARPPRATCPPGNAGDRPCAEASALALTVTVPRVPPVAAAGGFGACCAHSVRGRDRAAQSGVRGNGRVTEASIVLGWSDGLQLDRDSF